MDDRVEILAVEDDPDTQHLIKLLLGKRFDIHLAESADAARAILRERPDDIRVVLMDIALRGGEDGLSLTRWIRAQEPWRNLPIIATTAHALVEERAHALEAGCNIFLAKPINRHTLTEIIEGFLASA